MSVRVLIVIILVLTSTFFLFYGYKFKKAIMDQKNGYSTLENFHQYKNCNYLYNNLRKQIQKNFTTIVFIGSSIIERWDFEKYFPEKYYINRGIGENTSNDILKRFNDDVISLNPDFVVIYCTNNDTKFHIDTDDSIKNIQQMCIWAKSNNIEPILLLPIPVCLMKNSSLKYIYKEQTVVEYIEKCKIFCDSQGINYIDSKKFFKNNTHKNLYLDDGIHLNDNGYFLLSSEINNILK